MLYEKDLHLHNLNGSSHLEPKQHELVEIQHLWPKRAMQTRTGKLRKSCQKLEIKGCTATLSQLSTELWMFLGSRLCICLPNQHHLKDVVCVDISCILIIWHTPFSKPKLKCSSRHHLFIEVLHSSAMDPHFAHFICTKVMS